MVIVEIRRRLLQDPESVCVKRRHGAMPAWAISAGEVLQEEIAAAACFFCCLLLLLFQVLLAHEGTNTRCRVPERNARQKQRFLKRARSKKFCVRHSRGKLGQSKASGEYFWPTACSGRISCHPNIALQKYSYDSQI